MVLGNSGGDLAAATGNSGVFFSIYIVVQRASEFAGARDLGTEVVFLASGTWGGGVYAFANLWEYFFGIWGWGGAGVGFTVTVVGVGIVLGLRIHINGVLRGTLGGSRGFGGRKDILVVGGFASNGPVSARTIIRGFGTLPVTRFPLNNGFRGKGFIFRFSVTSDSVICNLNRTPEKVGGHN